MRRCDVCNCEAEILYTIAEEYREPGLNDICGSCNRSIEDSVNAALSTLAKLTRKVKGNVFRRCVGAIRELRKSGRL